MRTLYPQKKNAHAFMETFQITTACICTLLGSWVSLVFRSTLRDLSIYQILSDFWIQISTFIHIHSPATTDNFIAIISRTKLLFEQ